MRSFCGYYIGLMVVVFMSTILRNDVISRVMGDRTDVRGRLFFSYIKWYLFVDSLLYTLV